MAALSDPVSSSSSAVSSVVNFTILPVDGIRKPKYALDVDFFDGVTPRLKVIFQRSVGGAGTVGTVVDIASVNAKAHAKSKDTINKAFRPEDLADIEGSLAYTAEERAKDATQTVAVFDLQDHSHFYGDLAEIEKAEKDIIARLSASSAQGSGTIDKVRQCFIDNGVVFLVREGALKATILQSASLLKPEHLAFFKGHGQAFCQFTEFFMNAMKFGDEVVTDPNLVLGTYLEPLQGSADFTPCSRSIVAYPPSYHDMAMRGEYAMAMKSTSVFNAQIVEMPKEFVLGQFRPLI